MLLPETYPEALAALLFSLVCFAVWPMLYKRSQPRRRFELFGLDFAFGALAFSLLAAYTLGIFGSEMPFTDRMLVSGRAAQLWVFAAGVIFALGNMLLLAGISLLGLACALPLAFGTGGILISATHFRFLDAPYAAAALALLLLTVILAGIAPRRPMMASRGKPWLKGLVLATFAGAPLALVEWMLRHTSDPEFGPGPYASVLMLSLGFVVATPAYDFFFMHIKIVGNPIGFGQYMAGGFVPHIPGLLTGAVWSAGILALLAACNAMGEAELGAPLRFIVPLVSVLLCSLAGLFLWREYSGSARYLLLLMLCCFIAGVIAAGFSYPPLASSL